MRNALVQRAFYEDIKTSRTSVARVCVDSASRGSGDGSHNTATESERSRENSSSVFGRESRTASAHTPRGPRVRSPGQRRCGRNAQPNNQFHRCSASRPLRLTESIPVARELGRRKLNFNHFATRNRKLNINTSRANDEHLLRPSAVTLAEAAIPSSPDLMAIFGWIHFKLSHRIVLRSRAARRAPPTQTAIKWAPKDAKHVISTSAPLPPVDASP